MEGQARVKRHRRGGPALRIESVASVPGHIIAASQHVVVYTDGYRVLVSTGVQESVVHGGPADSVYVAVSDHHVLVASANQIAIFRETEALQTVTLAHPVVAVALSNEHFAAASASELVVDRGPVPAARQYSCMAFASASELVASAACNVYLLAPGKPEEPLFGTGGEAVLALAACDDRVAVATSDAVVVVLRASSASFVLRGAWTGVSFNGPYTVCVGLETQRLLYATSAVATIETDLPVLTCLLPDADGAAGLCAGKDGVFHNFGSELWLAGPVD